MHESEKHRLSRHRYRSPAPILAKICDLIGFSYYRSEQELIGSGLFDVLEAAPLEPRSERVGDHDYKLLVCEFTPDTAHLLGTANFNYWSSIDGSLNADDVFFFRAGKLLTQAKPREGLIEFHSADLDLLQEIQRAHPAFKGALFVIEDGKFAGVA